MTRNGDRRRQFLLVAAACAAIHLPALAAEDARTNTQSGAVSIVMVRQYNYDAGVEVIEDEARLVDCMTKAIRRTDPSRMFVPYTKLAGLVFAGLPAHRVPRSPEYLKLLMQDPRFTQSADALGLRYLVFVGGTTESTTLFEDGGCDAALGVGGCFYFKFVDKKSQLAASLVDVRQPDLAERNLTEGAAGASWFGIIGFIPVGYGSPTVQNACRDLGEHVGALLALRGDDQTNGDDK